MSKRITITHEQLHRYYAWKLSSDALGSWKKIMSFLWSRGGEHKLPVVKFLNMSLLLTNCAQRRQGEKESVVVRPLVLVSFFVRSFVQNRSVAIRVQLLDELFPHVSVYLSIMFGEQFCKTIRQLFLAQTNGAARIF